MILNITLPSQNYNIHIQDGILSKIADFTPSSGRAVVITDENIPIEYINLVCSQLTNPLLITVKSGEQSKSISVYEKIIKKMLQQNICRNDYIIALGGGVVGDLSGFVASTYYRGIDYIQIPTSLLAMVDSSVGGKVAINIDNVKNVIGQFYHPNAVLIDPDTLSTLPKRHFNNAMAEIIKYGVILDSTLFEKLLDSDIKKEINSIIYRCLELKASIVIKDEQDFGVRKILNFGHTIGHALESYYDFNKYLHGEAVAIGMVSITKNIDVKKQLISVLNKYELPTAFDCQKSDLLKHIKNDKKTVDKEMLEIITVSSIGTAKIEKVKLSEVIKWVALLEKI